MRENDRNTGRQSSAGGQRRNNTSQFRGPVGFGRFAGNRRRKVNTQNKPQTSMAVVRKNKLRAIFWILLVVLFCFIVRLFYINKVHGLEYQKNILSNQMYETTVIPFKRGDILDRMGSYLATSEKVYTMKIDAKSMYRQEGKYFEHTLEALGQCFEELDVNEVRQYVLQHQNSMYYVPKNMRRMTYNQISEYTALCESDNSLKGVAFDEEYRRAYPNGTLASTILGFTKNSSSIEGQYGLEEAYNSILMGQDGRVYGYQNDDSALERTVKDAVDGYTIHTTIDATIQGIVERCLSEFNETYKDNYRPGNGAQGLGCIIMDVNTAEVLAMSDYPGYDPGNYKDTTPLLGTNYIEETENAKGYKQHKITKTIIDQEFLDQMTEEEKNINLTGLWKNYCISNTYEPGSTMKPFTVAAALEDGTITGNEVYACNGSLEVGDYEIKCHTYASGGDGAVTVQDSIAWSCNVALMKIGMAMGKKEFCTFQRNFNFGLKTNIDLAGEARTASLVYDNGNMLETDLATNTFGQNFHATMIQMITGFCSLINGGYYYEPHVVNKITNSSGATIKNIEPRLLKQVISESTSQKIRQYTRATVMAEGGDRRTGKTARPAGYAIGGKTGTAETIPRKNGEYVVSFMGYAPADNPQIAIYVVVDRPNVRYQDDAKFATGIVRNILTEVLPYMHIYMTEELTDKEIRELEERQLEITLKQGSAEETDEVTTAEPEYIQEGDIIDSTGEKVSIYPIWMTYPIDPATGYRVHPVTGVFLDASTGEPIDNQDTLDDGLTNNDNLITGDNPNEGISEPQ